MSEALTSSIVQLTNGQGDYFPGSSAKHSGGKGVEKQTSLDGQGIAEESYAFPVAPVSINGTLYVHFTTFWVASNYSVVHIIYSSISAFAFSC